MLIDLRNLLSGAKDDMTVSAPLEMETFRRHLRNILLWKSGL